MLKSTRGFDIRRTLEIVTLRRRNSRPRTRRLDQRAPLLLERSIANFVRLTCKGLLRRPGSRKGERVHDWKSRNVEPDPSLTLPAFICRERNYTDMFQ